MKSPKKDYNKKDQGQYKGNKKYESRSKNWTVTVLIKKVKSIPDKRVKNRLIFIYIFIFSI
jgi:hypothetical protein